MTHTDVATAGFASLPGCNLNKAPIGSLQAKQEQLPRCKSLLVYH